MESLSCSLSGIKVIEGSDTSLVGSSLLQQPKDTFSSMCNSPVTKAPSSMYCNVCDVHLNSTTQMISHVNGKKHQVNLKRSVGQVGFISPIITFLKVDVSDVKNLQDLLPQTTAKSPSSAPKPVCNISGDFLYLSLDCFIPFTPQLDYVSCL